MVRAPCCEQMGLKKGPWTPEEDQILISYIQRNGHGNWRALPKQAGLLRCGKSCRLRWKNYLQPDIKRGNFSKEEEETIIKLHKVLGNRWSAIAGNLPGRTDNEIKNYWHTHLKKRLEQKINSTVPQSNETVHLQRDFSDEARIPSKPTDNLTTHKETTQSPESPDVSTPILQQQYQPELSDSISIEGTDASGIFSGSSTEGNIYMAREFAAKGGMNYGSSNVMEFWYNILMQAAGNSREMQVNLGQFN